ncbi:MAG TPA: polymer-forming cytoskeletal protein [Anaeromyxobacter sp.]|nr:polymer-forming cytoskeletal protein [Anaeromyxobacter sp.]
MALWNNKQEQMPMEAGPVPGRYPDVPAPRRDDPLPPPPVRRDEPAPSPSGQVSDLLLGPGAEFDGKLTFRGTLRIDAKFTGSIVTDDVLIVGEHARMSAEITCGTIVVHGEVNGNVRATSGVELRHTGKLRGDVTSPSLVVEKGALLQGAVKPGDKLAGKR